LYRLCDALRAISNVQRLKTKKRKCTFRPSNVSQRLLDANTPFAKPCWTFHQAVIERLGVRVVLCFGQKSGGWVRKQLNAYSKVDQFVEQYKKRHWMSISYKNSDGVAVVVATHPSIADWTTPEADPSLLVKRILEVTD
jgi:hypothetical protein